LLQQFFQRQLESVRDEPFRRQVAAHVEQRESLRAYLRLVAMPVHLHEHLLLADRVAVLVGEQGRRRRRSAAEVISLRHRGLEPRLFQAGQLYRVAAAMRCSHLHGRGRCRPGRNEAGCTQQHGKAGRSIFHSPGSANWTLTTVAFWINTLAPLFWITVLMPVASAKALPVRVLVPLMTCSAWLPETV